MIDRFVRTKPNETTHPPEFDLYGYVSDTGVFLPSTSVRLFAKKRRLTAAQIYTLRPADAKFAILRGDNVWGVTNIMDAMILHMLDPEDMASVMSVEFGEIQQFPTSHAAIMAATFEAARAE